MNDSALAAAVHRALAQRDQTVAVAESLTGGLLAAELTRTPGASSTFRGGLVVYATELKADLAGVSPAMLATYGAVSSEVAAALAEGVRARLAASFGLAVTGVAGPDLQEGKPVGTVHLAVAGPDRDLTTRSAHLPGDRDGVRAAAVRAAMRLLADQLSVPPPAEVTGSV